MRRCASRVHHQMKDENRDGDDPEIGAIQATDIVREELTRAATLLEDGKDARPISRNMQRLGSWAAECKRKKGEPISSSSESIETPVGNSAVKSKSRTKLKPKLAFKRVQDEGSNKTTGDKSVSQSQDVRDLISLLASQPEETVQSFKRFVVKKSTIAGAGRGLFLLDKASDGEKITRYSGKLLSAETARKSSSKYLVKISEDQFLDGGGENEWEGKFGNCARKTRVKVNARFAPSMKLHFCQSSGRHYLIVLAVGSIRKTKDGTEIFYDYRDKFWEKEDGQPLELPSPELNGDRTPQCGKSLFLTTCQHYREHMSTFSSKMYRKSLVSTGIVCCRLRNLKNMFLAVITVT